MYDGPLFTTVQFFFTQYVPVVSHGLLWLQNNLGT